jgi:hypothetical protein
MAEPVCLALRNLGLPPGDLGFEDGFVSSCSRGRRPFLDLPGRRLSAHDL